MSEQLSPPQSGMPVECEVVPCSTALVPCEVVAECDVARIGESIPAEERPRSLTITLDPAIGRMVDNRWVVTGLLMCVGPLGLPALWLSRRFSRTAKIAMTTAFLLATVVLPLVVSWYFLDITLQPLVEAFENVLPLHQ